MEYKFFRNSIRKLRKLYFDVMQKELPREFPLQICDPVLRLFFGAQRHNSNTCTPWLELMIGADQGFFLPGQAAFCRNGAGSLPLHLRSRCIS